MPAHTLTKTTAAALAALTAALPLAAHAEDALPLAAYFGFDPLRVVAIDEGVGPAVAGDFNGDGRTDLAAVNALKGRVELLLLRDEPKAPETAADNGANDLPTSPWFDPLHTSITSRLAALAAADITDAPGHEIVYLAAQPGEIGVIELRGDEPRVAARRRIPGLAAIPGALAVADLDPEAPGDTPRHEAAVLLGDTVALVAFDQDGRPGEPNPVSAPATYRALHAADLDGDGRTDLLAIVPDARPAARVWLQDQRGLELERRLDLAPLVDAAVVTLPDRAAAALATIERQSRRVAIGRLSPDAAPDRALGEIIAFRDGAQPARVVLPVALGPAPASGATAQSLLVTEPGGNALAIYRPDPEGTLRRDDTFPTLANPTGADAGPWADGHAVFVMSVDERVVGVSPLAPDGTIGFPTPLPIAPGDATPVLIRAAAVDGEPRLVVLLRDRRDLRIELHAPGADAPAATIELENVRREPTEALVYDADADGRDDLLLLTPGETLRLVRSVGDANPQVLGEDDMPNLGLAELAGPDNTAVLDADADGRDELVFAAKNFVRTVAFDAQSGWRVLAQSNVALQDPQLASLAALDDPAGRTPPSLVAADASANRLVILEPDPNRPGAWEADRTLDVEGFRLGPIRALRRGPGLAPAVVSVGPAGAAVIRPGEPTPGFQTLGDWRADADERFEHALAAGDLNGDGYTDLAVLDAGEQMCTILSVADDGSLLFATEFKVFEQRLYNAGSRTREPSQAIIADLTGDGAEDLALVVHDRILIYPQQTRPTD